MFEFVSDAVFYGGLGLLIGWNVLPQPKWVKNLWDKGAAWVQSKL